MALYSNRCVCLCQFRPLALKIMQPYLSLSVNESTKDKTGVLDDFTSQLMKRQSFKWERRKNLAQRKIKFNVSLTDVGNNYSNRTIENLDFDTINQLFQRAIDYDDTLTITDLTKQCINYNRIPSLSILLHVLSLCSRKGDKNTIIEVTQLCEKVRPEILRENSHFEHYIAEAVWIKGNITKSLNIFEKVYKENIYLRRKIRFVLRHLILDSVASRSEATLINLMQFSDMLVKEYNDFFTVGCLWQACILSEWFSDQQIALDLLDKYTTGLCDVIVSKIPLVVRMSLRRHRTDVVYRLTEALLKLKMESEIDQILLALLDYSIQQGDFRQCKEIVLWSIQNNIKVPTIIYSEKLMDLLAKDIKDIKTKLKVDPPKRTPVDYQF